MTRVDLVNQLLRYMLRVAGQLYLPRDPCSEISGAGLSKKRDEVPRAPCSETSEAGLSKKRVEDPRPGQKTGRSPPLQFVGKCVIVEA